MIEFKILKKSKTSRARLGILKTAYGLVETPSLVPVATQAVIKTLSSEQVQQTKTQILIANTFHLHLRPGEKVIKIARGLHQFMHWPRPLMTDSGGFQVYSFGFGRDLNIGKVFKYFPGKNSQAVVDKKAQPRSVKITDEGVHFQSPYDGQRLFLGPKESIKIQQALGADIIFAFDECTSPLSTFHYVKESLQRTHRWARLSLKYKKSHQAIFGIVQGSRFQELRQESARFINSLDFDGFGIGGDPGHTKQEMKKIIGWVVPLLDERKPRHMLGIGYLDDIENLVKSGIDTFDCTVPTHYARRGVAFTSFGRLDLGKAIFLKDKKPVDSRCSCFVCQNYKRNYLCHLLRAYETTAFNLLTFHNLYFFNTFVEEIREKIKRGRI